MIQYRRAHLIDKPTAVGWHQFVLTDSLARCVCCHGIVPLVAVEDGSWRWRIGGRCREFLRPIGQHSTNSTGR